MFESILSMISALSALTVAVAIVVNAYEGRGTRVVSFATAPKVLYHS